MDIQEKVYNTLKNSDAPLRGSEIAEKAGIEKKLVDKAIKSLVKEAKVYSPKRCFYDVK